MFWPDGSNYRGDWEMGVKHGFGEITLANGKVLIGIFNNDVFVGPVKDDSVKPKKLKIPKGPVKVDMASDPIGFK
jgi:hypothetical protein